MQDLEVATKLRRVNLEASNSRWASLWYSDNAGCCRIAGNQPNRGTIMDLLSQYFELISRHALEPSLAWVINHPIVSLVVVFVAVWVSVRNYRML